MEGPYRYDNPDQTQLKLVLEDGQRQARKTVLVKNSGFIQRMFEDSSGQAEDVVVLTGTGLAINTWCIDRFLQFTQLSDSYVVKIKTPIYQDSQLATVLPPAYAQFLVQFTDDEQLCHMILVANYLECQELLDLLSAHLAVKISGKTPESVREFFGVQHGFANEAEELARIDRENEAARELLGINSDD